MEPDLNYRVLHCEGAFGPLPTARALNQGTWDIPLLALETERNPLADRRDAGVRFVVAEGSSEWIFNALRHRGAAPGPTSFSYWRVPTRDRPDHWARDNVKHSNASSILAMAVDDVEEPFTLDNRSMFAEHKLKCA